jgi:hypothetical protein
MSIPLTLDEAGPWWDRRQSTRRLESPPADRSIARLSRKMSPSSFRTTPLARLLITVSWVRSPGGPPISSPPSSIVLAAGSHSRLAHIADDCSTSAVLIAAISFGPKNPRAKDARRAPRGSPSAPSCGSRESGTAEWRYQGPSIASIRTRAQTGGGSSYSRGEDLP